MENAFQESFPESFVGCLDSGYLDDVDTNSQDHGKIPNWKKSQPTIRIFDLATITLHLGEHLLDRGGKPNGNGSPDHAGAEGQFNQMRHGEQQAKVLIIQSVARVDSEAKEIGVVRRRDKAIYLRLAIISGRESFRECAGMEFDKLASGAR